MRCEEAPLLEFLRADLSPEETRQMDAHLEDCQECRERLRVMAALESLYDDRASTEGRLPGRPRRFLLLAAGFLVALMAPVLFYFWQEDRPHNENSLSALTTDEAYPYFPLQTRSDDPIQSARTKGFEAYAEGDFSEAAVWLSQAKDAESLFYLGVSQYLSGQFDESLTSLGKASQEDPAWREASLWYEVNIFLKLERRQEAEQGLRKLLEAPQYQIRARRLLDEIQFRGG
ncbi:MAG: zf-HC2 domain-containing protein [Acidobacteriota bacterium]